MFLEPDEWLAEIKTLLDDLRDEHRNTQQEDDPRSEAAIAWSKISAVYPSLDRGLLTYMVAEEVMASNPGASF
jgi:hypothetical protein